MTKLFGFLLAISILVVGSGVAWGQVNLSYTYTPGSATIGCGDTLTADVEVDTIADLLGYSLTLTYDPAVFQPVSAIEGGLIASTGCDPFIDWLNAGTNDGTVEVDLAMLGCTVNGAGSILTVRFIGLQTGATPFASALSLAGTLRDSLNQEISYSTSPGNMNTFCNYPPLAVDDSDSTPEDTPLITVNVLTNDGDPDGDAFNLLSHDPLSTSGGTVADNGNGTFTYTPPQDFVGLDTFDYIITDTDLTDAATVTITVTTENDPPVADAGLDQSADEGDNLSFSGSFNDPDAGDTHTFEWDFGDGTPVVTGTLTPNHTYGDNGVYEVVLTVTDQLLVSDSDTLQATVSNVAPTVEAGPDLSDDEGVLVSLGASSFTDPGSLDTHSATIDWGDGTAVEPATLPGGGVVDGSHVYADDGVYTVTVTVTDDDLGQGFDTLSLTISNQAPTVTAGLDQTLDEGTILSLDPADFNDLGTLDTHTATIDWGDATPIDAGTVTESPFGPPGNVLGSDGTVDGSHLYADDGAYTVTVTVTDDETIDGSDTFLATVQNLAPIATDEVYATPEETQLVGNVLTDDTGQGIDSDPGGDPMTVDPPVSGPSNGALVLNPDGSFTYDPDPEFNGIDVFTYTTSDDDGGTSIAATVTITVNGTNDAPTAQNPGGQAYTEREVVSLQIVATDPDAGDVLAYSALGLPTSLTINPGTGLIDGTLACGDATGSPYDVSVIVADNGAPSLADTADFQISVGPLPAPAVVTGLASTPVGVANDSDGTTEIQISWTGSLQPGETIEVYRKGHGGYPEYDDLVGPNPPALPTTPTEATSNGWALTSVTTSGATDEPADRDFWYYVVFVVNECGTASVASNMSTGTLNYHLGDVSPGGSAPPFGDNLVDLIDISKLGAHYGTTEPGGQYLDTLDVGPTTDFSVRALPTTDNQIQFEDLMMFAINFGAVSKPGLRHQQLEPNGLTIQIPETGTRGERIEVSIELAADGTLQGVSVPLTWDPSRVEPMEMAPGDLVQSQPGQLVVLSPRPGAVDAATFGSTIGGKGVLATVGFRVLSPGDPGIGVDEVLARNVENQQIRIPFELKHGREPGTVTPTVTRLLPGSPNPFQVNASIRFELAAESDVGLLIYGVDGRLVRNLLAEWRPAGVHELVWDARDDQGHEVASGIYLIRFVAPGVDQIHKLVRIR